jgi:hypothetical protein
MELHKSIAMRASVLNLPAGSRTLIGNRNAPDSMYARANARRTAAAAGLQ